MTRKSSMVVCKPEIRSVRNSTAASTAARSATSIRPAPTRDASGGACISEATVSVACTLASELLSGALAGSNASGVSMRTGRVVRGRLRGISGVARRTASGVRAARGGISGASSNGSAFGSVASSAISAGASMTGVAASSSTSVASDMKDRGGGRLPAAGPEQVPVSSRGPCPWPVQELEPLVQDRQTGDRDPWRLLSGCRFAA